MNKNNTEFKYLISLWIVLFVGIILTYAHHGNILIDCGREAYYPTQVLLGKVLYKDIFNIYGPFAYMFNAFLFKIFSINLNVLYIAGCFCAFTIVSLIYLISKRFLSNFVSFAIAVFTISIGVLNTNLFNLIFPYSYGMLYGITAFLVSVWCFLKYQNEIEKIIYLYFGCFFAGLCITSKYEFLPYLIVVLYSIIKIKPLKIKEYYYSIFALLFVPIFCFGILFLQGLRLSDLASTAAIIETIAKTKTLKFFYQTQGVYFHKKLIAIYLISLLKTVLPLSLLIYGLKKTGKTASIILSSLALIMIAFLTTPTSLIFFPIAIAIIAIINLKKILKNTPLTILTLSGITLSIKIFWGLTTLNYGVFFASFLLITLLALILNLFDDKIVSQKPIGIYILAVAIVLGCQNLLALKAKTESVSTANGGIYTEAYLSTSTNELINYIKLNTKKTDTIAIFPEGTMINFLTQRPADNNYSSLIPLYVETFGDEKIIKYFEKIKPEYIILNNWDTKDYYYKYICNDYAVSFCNYVAKNYTQEKVIDNGLRYLIFKKR